SAIATAFRALTPFGATASTTPSAQSAWMALSQSGIASSARRNSPLSTAPTANDTAMTAIPTAREARTPTFMAYTVHTSHGRCGDFFCMAGHPLYAIVRTGGKQYRVEEGSQ